MDPGDMKAGMPLRVPQNVLEEGLGQLRGEIAFWAGYRLKNLLARGRGVGVTGRASSFIIELF